jgi:hypothetical protein
MSACIEDAAIPICMVGLLYALPGTELSHRLLAEGRLHADSDRLAGESDADQCTSGLNFVTARPRGAILADYRAILARINAPAAFFGRVRRLNRELDLSRQRQRRLDRRSWRELRAFARIGWRLGVRDREVRSQFWRTLATCLIHNPRALHGTMSFAALYLHVKSFSGFMDERLAAQIAALPLLPEALLAECPKAAEAHALA